MSQKKRDWNTLIQQTQRNPNLGARTKQQRIMQYRREMTMENQREAAGGQAETRPAPAATPRSDSSEKAPRRTSVPRIDHEMKKLGIY